MTRFIIHTASFFLLHPICTAPVYFSFYFLFVHVLHSDLLLRASLSVDVPHYKYHLCMDPKSGSVLYLTSFYYIFDRYLVISFLTCSVLPFFRLFLSTIIHFIMVKNHRQYSKKSRHIDFLSLCISSFFSFSLSCFVL